MFYSSLDIRSPLGLTHRHHQDWLALSPSDPSSSSHVYNLWQNASSDFPNYTLPTSPPDPIRRSFPNVAYQDDRSSNSRLVPMLPYSSTANDTFSRRSTFAPPTSLPLSPSPQHIPTSTNSQDERSSRSLIFDPIYSSPSYTLSAAISSAPGSATPATSSPGSAPLLPPPPPPSSCSPHTSPSSSPPSSPDCHHITPPSLPSVHAFRLDTLQSVDPSDDPCPLSLHDLMIPSEEQEYQGHSYHFSLQSVSPSNPKPQSFSDEKVPHEESALPKRKGKSKMHTCSLCQKSFPRPSGLRTHMNSHSGDKRMSSCVAFPYLLTQLVSRLAYKCPVTSCAKSFTVRSNAKRHIRTHGVNLAQAAEAASIFGVDSSLVPTDKDPQRALRIRWVGQNLEEHPEDHSSGQSSNPQGSACITDLRHDSNVDDDNFRTSRLEDGRNRGTLPERRPCTTSGSEARSRFVH